MPADATPRTDSRNALRSPLLITYIAMLAAGAAGAAIALGGSTFIPPGSTSAPALPAFVALLVAAEYLFVRFRYRGDVNGLNLVEAVLAPMLFAFSPVAVVASVAVAQLAGAVLRRNDPVKGAFNIAQWSLAAAAGAATMHALAPASGISAGSIAALVAALAAVGVVNQVLFTVVLVIVNRDPVPILLRGLGPVVVPGWIVGWVVNSLIGMLFLLAYEAHPAAVLLFPVPLSVLHLAYRGYAGARSDRNRLAGLHEAAQILTEPIDPTDAIGPFLAEVASSFEARAAALVLRTKTGRTIHRLDRATGELRETFEESSTPSLEGALLAAPGAVRVRSGLDDPIARALGQGGWRECLSAPLTERGQIVGALLVLDQAGLEGFEEGELAVVEALARETAGVFAKGRLLGAIIDERRKLDEIVSSTSDGILTVGPEGTIRTWNAAMERITGLLAADVVGRRNSMDPLKLSAAGGGRVRLDRWIEDADLPADVTLRTAGGSVRRLQCSYSRSLDSSGRPGTLIVVARDVTPYEQLQQLRAEAGRLAQAWAAEHEVVEQLQAAVMPPRPSVAGADLGVRYVASDPRTPTGGDLYDWQVLPGGDVHLSVVDVLGHGVAATKNALSVVHALRLLAVGGCPLEEMVARADATLGAVTPDLVATVVVGRYTPATNRVRLAGGGHPPPLRVRASGAVEQIALPGGAIGWPGAGSQSVAEITLEGGDALVLYTDGLIEAGKDIIEGEEALLRHARTLAGSAAERFATGLVERSLAEGSRRDDSLALVLRRLPEVETGRWRLHPSPADASRARVELQHWMGRRTVPDSVGGDVALVAAELLANAVMAAREWVELRVEARSDRVVLEIEDDGAGVADLDRRGHALPPPSSESGRGLFVARTLSTSVETLSTPSGTLVRCVVPVPAAPITPPRAGVSWLKATDSPG